MTATVQVRRWTGATPTKTDVTSINTVLNAEDTHQTTAAGSNNPIRIPSSGTNYSYSGAFCFNCTVAPAGTINALKFYMDGANNLGTGIGLNVAMATRANYTTATGTAGTTGVALSNAAGDYSGKLIDLGGSVYVANAFNYTSGSPLSIAGSTTGTGDFGDLVLLQITVGTSASPGPSGQETASYQYDET